MQQNSVKCSVRDGLKLLARLSAFVIKEHRLHWIRLKNYSSFFRKTIQAEGAYARIEMDAS